LQSAKKIVSGKHRRLTMETTMAGQAGASQPKRPISFINQYIPIVEYTYKSGHSFDERKKHYQYKKNRPFPGDGENSPQKPSRQVGPEAHNAHGQFLSSINTGCS
jgi:hypothetical protein